MRTRWQRLLTAGMVALKLMGVAGGCQMVPENCHDSVVVVAADDDAITVPLMFHMLPDYDEADVERIMEAVEIANQAYEGAGINFEVVSLEASDKPPTTWDTNWADWFETNPWIDVWQVEEIGYDIDPSLHSGIQYEGLAKKAGVVCGEGNTHPLCLEAFEKGHTTYHKMLVILDDDASPVALAHELGHIGGLGHAGDDGNLMNAGIHSDWQCTWLTVDQLTQVRNIYTQWVNVYFPNWDTEL